MADYYTKRSSLIALMYGLEATGWKIYGFKEDRSDSMTDYFDPARWEGIAVKNGYVLVIDNKYYDNRTIGGDFIKSSFDSKIVKRIEKLKALRDNAAAAPGEKQNAQAMIDKLSEKVELKELITSDLPEIRYGKNPGSSSWHIEKNGKIIAKGSGVFGFNSLEYSFRRTEEDYYYTDKEEHNINLCIDIHRVWNVDNFEDWAKYRKEEREKETKLFDKYFKLIDKWNSYTVIKLGDGEEETLKEKTICKDEVYYIAEETTEKTDYIKVGERWNVSGLSSYDVFKITDKKDDSIYIKKLTRNWVDFEHEILNKKQVFKTEPRKTTKSKYLHLTAERLEKGVFVYVKLIPVVRKVYETVYVKETKKTTQQTKPTENKNVPALTNEDLKEFEDLFKEGRIEDFEHTKTGESLKVLKLSENLSKDEFKAFNTWLKSHKMGYYSRYAKGFILAA